MKTVLKSISILIITIFCVSCSVDDEVDDFQFSYKLVPVVEADIPDTLYTQETYHFDITYEIPSSCYDFSGFDYSEDGNQRYIGVVCSAIENDACGTYDPPETETKVLEFSVKQSDYYIFKFWKGTDAKDKPIYYKKTAIVIDGNSEGTSN